MSDNSSRALTSFNRKDISARFLITLSGDVIQGVKGNPLFPNQDTVMGILVRTSTEFKDAWEASRNGTAESKQRAKTKKVALRLALLAVCNFVNYVADGDRAILLTTNFPLNKETRKNVVLTEVKGFKVEYGINSGEMIPSFKKEAGTTSVGFQYSEDEEITVETKWTTVQSGKSKCVISGLTPGQRVHFRINIGGPRNQSVFSNIISKNVGSGQ